MAISNSFAELMDFHPVAWGLRGDPSLWRIMQEQTHKATLPDTANELQEQLFKWFTAITSHSIFENEPFKVEMLSMGGMSAGYVCPVHWREVLIPEIIERFEGLDDDKFKIIDLDLEAIQVAESVARKLLAMPDIKPEQIVAIGNALYAIKRIPMYTSGVYVTYGLVLKGGDSNFREMKYIDFKIFESEFEIVIGGSTYEKGIGSDSYTQGIWKFSTYGEAFRDIDLYLLNETISEFINLGCEITTENESTIVFE